MSNGEKMGRADRQAPENIRCPTSSPSELALLRMLDLWRIDVWQVMLAFFRQMFRASYPVTGFAGAGCFVVAQTPVQCLGELDSFTQ